MSQYSAINLDRNVAMQRRLGSIESATVVTDEFSPFNVVGVLQLSGSPDSGDTRRSLNTLQSLHPLLTARIRRNGGHLYFEDDSAEPLGLRVRPRLADTDWTGVVEEELANAFDTARGPLARCTLLCPPDPSKPAEVVFTFHHAIVDAVSGAHLFHQLLSLLTAKNQGHPIARKTSPGPFPLPADQLFPARFRGSARFLKLTPFLMRELRSEVTYRLRNRDRFSPPAPKEARCRVLPVTLTPETTRKIMGRCRDHRVTLNSALCAAILLAARRICYNDENGDFRTIVFVDLRPHLAPPPDEETLACYIGMYRLTLRLDRSSGLWPISRSVQETVYRSGKRGERFSASLMSRHFMRMALAEGQSRMGATAVSYNGAVRLDGRYGDLSVNGLHAFISNNSMGPLYTAQALLFQGRLNLDIVYLDADMNPEKANSIRDLAICLLEGE